MLRGSGYAIAEIIFWMIGAAVLGGTVGWLLRRWIGLRRITRDHEAALVAGRAERERLSAELSSCRADLASGQARVEELAAELAGLRTRLDESRSAGVSVTDPVDPARQIGDDLGTAGAGSGAEADTPAPVETLATALEQSRQERDRLVAEVEELAAVVADLEGRLSERGG